MIYLSIYLPVYLSIYIIYISYKYIFIYVYKKWLVKEKYFWVKTVWMDKRYKGSPVIYGKKNLRFCNILPFYLVLWPGSCSKLNCFKRPWSCSFLKNLCPLNAEESVEGLHKTKKLFDNVQAAKFTNTQIKWLSYDYRWSVIIWLFCQDYFWLFFLSCFCSITYLFHILFCYIWTSSLLAAAFSITLQNIFA